jgi:cyclopropane fatty-acyl-phospholipid synthase-like methyltransferase
MRTASTSSSTAPFARTSTRRSRAGASCAGLPVRIELKDYRDIEGCSDKVVSMRTDPWIARCIFPNGKIPSARQLTLALEGRFLIDDRHNFGPDYDRTLMAWWENVDVAWPRLQAKYAQRIYRMWK